jgi:HTH-type transcriptional regulator/antitoxin HigA
MKVKVIKAESEYQAALQRIKDLMDSTSGTPEGEELELLSLLVGKYEQEHFPVEPPDPVDAILFRMDQQGLSAKDMIPYLGSQSRVSEVLNRKRPLSMAMIRKLHTGLGIPLESLIKESVEEPTDGGQLGRGKLNAATVYFSCAQLSEDADSDMLDEWYWKATKKAEKEILPTFEWNKIDHSLFIELLRLCSYTAGPGMAVELLHKKGIHLVVQKISFDLELDGACFFLPGMNPMICMTLRNNRADDFWLTLLHLTGHLYLHKGEKSIAILDSIKCAYDNNTPSEENKVNQFLQDMVNNLEGSEKTWQNYKKALDKAAGEEEIENTELNPELLSCLYRIETKDMNKAIRRAASRKVNEKLEIYEA